MTLNGFELFALRSNSSGRGHFDFDFIGSLDSFSSLVLLVGNDEKLAAVTAHLDVSLGQKMRMLFYSDIRA